MQTFHILNGDCLAEIFPEKISGETIIWRECLVDGPLDSEDFFLKRERFIKDNYNIPDADYQRKVLAEFERFKNIPDNSLVYFWFEDDLFCQINFWFLIHHFSAKNCRLYRIFPLKNEIYYPQNSADLEKIFEEKFEIPESDITEISDLWKAFSVNEIPKISDKIKSIRRKREISQALSDWKGGAVKDWVAAKSGLSESELLSWFNTNHPIFGFGDLRLKNFK